MTDLKRLKVSTTKYGANTLLDRMQNSDDTDFVDSILAHRHGIQSDRPQTSKILSVDVAGQIHPVWRQAVAEGTETLTGLLLFGIIFSHHEFIDIFKRSTTSLGKGIISKTNFASVKSYTNLKKTLIDFGFAKNPTPTNVEFDFNSVFLLPRFNLRARTLLRLKLLDAGWDEHTDLIDECLFLGFHQVVGMTTIEFKEWFGSTEDHETQNDELPELVDPDQGITPKFEFYPGHTSKSEGIAATPKSNKNKQSRLRHNEIQNALYKILAKQYGTKNVRSEMPTGVDGTNIDIAVRHCGHFIFYEIKTSKSVKKCLRQAISQLLEYAHWPDRNSTIQLIVVGEPKLTSDARKYLTILQRKFYMSINYQQIDMELKKLVDP